MSLYLAQSIPMSFFSTIVPVIMRQEKYSLAMIGLLQLIKLPWIFKFLWAPFVDRYSTSIASYKRWIFGAELFYAAVIIGIGFLDLKVDFQMIIALVVIAITASATQDIATDAFAIKILEKDERSMGNSMQSAGSFLGTMTGSGVLLVLYHYFGWQGMMICLALFVLIALIPLYFYKHYKQKGSAATAVQSGNIVTDASGFDRGADVSEELVPDAIVSAQSAHGATLSEELATGADITEQSEKKLRRIRKASLKDIGLFFKQKDIYRRVILLFFFYSGIIGILSLMKPFLVDHGFTTKQIGILSGICGTASGAISAILGGVIIKNIGRRKSLYVFSIFSFAVTLLFVILMQGRMSFMLLYTSVVLLWISYGMSSVAIYTISMDIVRPGREGTDFTLQIVITHLSGLLVTIASGKLADILGFQGLFIIESIMAALVILSIRFLYREPATLRNCHHHHHKHHFKKNSNDTKRTS